MTHEKIYKRKDGTLVKISVWLYVHQNRSNWGYLMFVKEPGSDRWLDPFTDRDYLRRYLEEHGHNASPRDTYDHFVTAKEIRQAKLELWEMIKPV